MRCPRCGSPRLMWDHAYGYVVCEECGLVIEPILDDASAGAVRGDAVPPRRARPLPRQAAPRSPRVAAALQAYLEARRAGLGREKSIRIAARLAGLSPRTVRNALVRYRLGLDGLWEGLSRGGAGGPGFDGEEDIRADVRRDPGED